MNHRFIKLGSKVYKLRLSEERLWVGSQSRSRQFDSNWRFLIFNPHSSSRIMSSFFSVVTVTRRLGLKPNVSSQRPLSVISGTVVALKRLNLVIGWIFRLLTSGWLPALFFLDVRIIL